MQLEKMITEGSNAASAEIDRVSTLEMCRIINDEDKTVPLAVERVLPDIAAAIDVIHAGQRRRSSDLSRCGNIRSSGDSGCQRMSAHLRR
ncbi:hypothetical protein ECZU29_34840 [Escherichia coli]|nr:hypothetical protein ECZU29_34840 [Escherichia coli]